MFSAISWQQTQKVPRPHADVKIRWQIRSQVAPQSRRKQCTGLGVLCD